MAYRLIAHDQAKSLRSQDRETVAPAPYINELAPKGWIEHGRGNDRVSLERRLAKLYRRTITGIVSRGDNCYFALRGDDVMLVKAKDKRIKALNRGDRSVAGLQPNEEALILDIVTVLKAAVNLAVVSAAHPSWRVHHHHPRKASSPWSIDVTGNTRLLFEYNPKTHEITGARYDDPH